MAKRRWLRIEDQGYGMVVGKELLGQTITFPLGTAQATIVFPKVIAHFAGVDCVLSMKDLEDADFKVSANMEQEFGNLHCGDGFRYQDFLTPEGLESVELRRFIYIIEAEWELDAPTNGEAVWKQWDPYWALCKDWLEILTGQDINSGSTWSSKRREFNVWTENGDGPDAQKHGYSDIHSHSVNSLIPSEPISRRILENSLIQALEGVEVPLDDRLLRDARRSINLGDFRKSVIDCGSAIEVVLSKELIKLYVAKGKPQEDIDRLANKGTLGIIIDAWCHEGTNDFSNLDFSVSDLRNDIIHRGLTCSADKAIFVYELTREILETLGTGAVP